MSMLCGICMKPANECKCNVVEQAKNEKLAGQVAMLMLFVSELDKEYGLVGSWVGNGCEHGFKPASSCPNEDCAVAKLHRVYDYIAATESDVEAHLADIKNQGAIEALEWQTVPHEGMAIEAMNTMGMDGVGLNASGAMGLCHAFLELAAERKKKGVAK